MGELMPVHGKPGAGKSSASSAATLLVYGARHISMGDRLRGIASGEVNSRYSDELANSQERLAQHKPVGRPELPILVLEEFIDEGDGLVIVDGFPRYRNRMPIFRKMLERTGHHVVAVCHIDVADKVALERMTGRENRSESVIEDAAFCQRRIQDFYEEVVPVMRDMASFAPIYHIDGHPPLDAVANDIARVACAQSI